MPCFHVQLTTAANQPIRNLMPHNPVSDSSWIRSRLALYVYRIEPQLPTGPWE
jgi:hypothetical protein